DTIDAVLSAPSSIEVPSASQQTAASSTSRLRLPTRRAIRTARCGAQLATRDDVVSSLMDLSILQARQERLTRHINVLRRLLALLSDPDRNLPIIPIRLGTSTRVYRALWNSGSQGDFVHPRVVEEARLATSGSRSPISVTLGDNKTQCFFDQTVPDLHFSLTLQPPDSTQAPRRYHSSAYFDVLETGYNFILGTPWSRRFRSTEAEWAFETLILKTKCGQTHRVPFIGTTGDTPPNLPPKDPRPSGSHPNISFTSPRQFAHFIRQEDVTLYSVNVMDLLRYDPLCPEVELISLEPDPPDPSSIFAAPISTSTPQPADTSSTSQVPTPSTAESTHTSCADANVEELMRFTADLEPVIRDLIREYRDVFPPYFSYSGIPLTHTRCPALDDWITHMAAIMKRAHERLADSQIRMAARANRSRMDHPFKVGDDVLIDARHLQLEANMLRKFRRRFFGPCRILQAVGSDTAASPVSFRVKLPNYLRQARVHDVYHVSLLRPYRRPSERFAGRPYERPPPIMVDGHEEFVVSDIVSRRVTDDTPLRIEYLVRWKGYPDEEATWEPLEHLQHARMLVRAYDRARRAGTFASTQPTDPLPPPPAKEIAEDEPAPSEAVPQPQMVASERPQRTHRRPSRYDD
ncbi:hypothetical protein CBR_g75369, partial [Chara braunii]